MQSAVTGAALVPVTHVPFGYCFPFPPLPFSRAGLAMNGNEVSHTSLENEHELLKSNRAFPWAVFYEEQEKVVLVFSL